MGAEIVWKCPHGVIPWPERDMRPPVVVEKEDKPRLRRVTQTTLKGRSRRAARILMGEMLRRDLRPEEHVHHRDGDPFNNDPENLDLMPRDEHMRLHGLEQFIGQ
jgi:hypothetical protein